MQDSDLRLDGNAAAGWLHEIFGREMTAVSSTCAHCSNAAPLGALLVYASDIGVVMRCPTCNAALLRITHIRGRYCLDVNLAEPLTG
ncbi:MAG: hypothetical protein AVDCRST_MAG86-2730 [uncultured Truepera sp.]|uniref:Uncharacterized protein n=1 Tax=uncultured Truepera sp. TaxID=543023 RepID=A0A6J4VJC8_9DEIN|nr:MAG: hypothetical protein AVDCRST_MAG86-2730 [uncultured Truepera sp.]